MDKSGNIALYSCFQLLKQWTFKNIRGKKLQNPLRNQQTHVTKKQKNDSQSTFSTDQKPEIIIQNKFYKCFIYLRGKRQQVSNNVKKKEVCFKKNVFFRSYLLLSCKFIPVVSLGLVQKWLCYCCKFRFSCHQSVVFGILSFLFLSHKN